MRTDHEVAVGDARSMDALDDGAVELVVTSPPYPMIEMWDDTFAALNDAIRARLDRGDGAGAFELMHRELDAVWDELERVLAEGGIACIDVGDATRTVGGEFECYPNHARIVEAFRERGFDVLPEILWRKPTNSATKFMGSGMLPPNAYVTLEHEHILVFRNGEPRRFEAGAEHRYESAYFWEERNEWFSDVWEIRGTHQTLDGYDGGEGNDLRERSGAFPVAIPYRLINMYSVYGDTVLDPFWGTGTTTLVAMAAGRNSRGFEIEPEFRRVFDERLGEVASLARELIADRLRRHEEFVAEYAREDPEPEYLATHYDVPVVTKQERDIRFYAVDEVADRGDRYTVDYRPVDAIPSGATDGLSGTGGS